MYLSEQIVLICSTLNNKWSWKNVLLEQCCVKQYTTVEKGKKMYT